MTLELDPRAAESLAEALTLIAFVMGLLVGSFLNVVIHRVPLDLSVVSPPSRCPGCEAKIKPWDNVPVLSYLLLRGRCRGCGIAISMRYPLVELATGIVFAAIAYVYGLSPFTGLYCLFAAALIVAAMIDYDHQIIPDSISLGGLVFALIVVPMAHAYTGSTYASALTRSLAGALIGAGILWLVAFLHARLCVAMGRSFDHWPGEGESVPRWNEADYWLWFPGMGLGDVKLLGMIGAVLGPIGVLDTILASSVAGLAMGVIQGVAGGALGRPFGFAPAIAAGAAVSLFLPELWFARLF